MILTRDALLEPVKAIVKTVETEGLGTVRIRKLSYSEATKWRQMKGDDNLNLVALCLVDEDDKPILKPTDVVQIGSLDSSRISELVYEVMVANDFMRPIDTTEAMEAFTDDPDRLLLCRLAYKFGVSKADVFADSLTDEDLRQMKAVAMLDGWFDNEQWTAAADIIEEHLPEKKTGFMTPEQAQAVLAGGV